MAEHGTRANYARGCRCDKCRAANTTYYRERRRRDARDRWLSSLSASDRREVQHRVADRIATGDGQDLAEMVNLAIQSEYLSWVARQRLATGGAHGKLSTYSVYGCRCDQCSSNYLAWKRERRASR